MKLPDFEPMFAGRRAEPFDDENWWFEVKWDGYRAIVGAQDGEIRARSRRGLDLLGSFPELASIEIPDGVVVDGEIVAFDDQGRPSFSRLQRRTGFGGAPTGEKAGVNLVVFDVLFHGSDFTGLPYEERRDVLESLELSTPIVVPEPMPTHGISLFQAVQERGIEGIVAKRLGSRYHPGRRSDYWLKIAVRHTLQAVVGGYLPGEGGRASTFGSLLVGLYQPSGLRWIGAVGSGFSDSSLGAFHSALAQIERDTSPFTNDVAVPGPRRPVWVEPAIVVRVEYKEWTHEDHLRAPVFKGVDMTDPETVTWADEGPEGR
ncbi:MAG TPA: non-homologous end-joining DNA ligase [Acidimicrobiia bacterium]|nr:non-homologous end-joining DNA ligase [Acidimicrobiia bacterium]